MSTGRVEDLLRRLGPEDVADEPPPADLWDRIRSQLDDTGLRSGGALEYVIDADDVVVSVGDGWDEAARADGAADLVGTTVGRRLWDVMDPATASLWRLAVDLVRERGVYLTVPLRCDAPDARRWLEMTVSPAGAGAVRFRSELVLEVGREPVGLLLGPADGSAGTLEVCSWCARIRDGEQWVPVDEYLSGRRSLEADRAPAVRYGTCGSCHDHLAELAEPLSRK